MRLFVVSGGNPVEQPEGRGPQALPDCATCGGGKTVDAIETGVDMFRRAFTLTAFCHGAREEYVRDVEASVFSFSDWTLGPCFPPESPAP